MSLHRGRGAWSAGGNQRFSRGRGYGNHGPPSVNSTGRGRARGRGGPNRGNNYDTNWNNGNNGMNGQFGGQGSGPHINGGSGHFNQQAHYGQPNIMPPPMVFIHLN